MSAEKMKYGLALVILVFGIFKHVEGQASKYCPENREYFKEPDTNRYFCGDVCVDPDNRLCLKAKQNDCCLKAVYPNVTQLDMDYAQSQTNLNQSLQSNIELKKKLKSSIDNSTGLMTDLKTEKKKSNTYLYVVIVLGILLAIAIIMGIVAVYHIRELRIQQGVPATTNDNEARAPLNPDGHMILVERHEPNDNGYAVAVAAENTVNGAPAANT